MPKYKLAGLLSFSFGIASSLFGDNIFFSVLMGVTLLPYLYIKLLDLIQENTRYKLFHSVVIYFFLLVSIIPVFLILSGSFRVVYLFLVARGLAFFALGCLLIAEWRIQNTFIRILAFLILFLGGAYIHTGLFTQLWWLMTAKSLAIYGTIKSLMHFALYMLLGATFLSASKKYGKGIPVNQDIANNYRSDLTGQWRNKMQPRYIVILMVYLGIGFITTPDLQRIWSSGNSSLDFQMNIIIVLIAALYLWGVFKIVCKILGKKKNTPTGQISE